MNVTQIFLASTLYGAATLVAALDAGCLPAADRRILLTSNHSLTPEVTPGIESSPGFAALRTRFDEVLDWNAVIAPQHPATWAPRPEDVPLWERQLRVLWGLGGDRVELVVESLQVPPAQSLCRLFPGAAVDVYADGLMSYGPTRFRLDPQIGMRVRRVLHPDLVPGLEPLLLTEFGVPAELVPAPALVKVLAELADLPGGAADGYAPAEPPALLLGQYLAALELTTAAEEEELHAAMVRGAHARGHRELVFKPHPSAPAAYWRRAEEEAARLGARLTVLEDPAPAETLYARLRPALVVGCFSTGLMTARALYGIPVARTGTEAVLARLAPYPNSNRIPLTLVDALVPDLARDGTRHEDPADLPGLVTAVGFTMQPRILAEHRTRAEAYLAGHLDARTRRYFGRRRLTTLGLPGGLPARLAFLPRVPAVRRAAHLLRRRLGGPSRTAD
ncbi:polysialyltransferase family glycosyltransferase [Streptomyces sp. NPDC087917]|uniref:polysialyltransferase family glycosyltransferase n=1 Tax=unclassified Streptomyces TaxID=2593676 RepID=UPI003449EFD7